MREELAPIWKGIREELRRTAGDFKFHLWLDPLELAGIEARTLYVRAPEHIRSWVEERYLPLLRRAAARSFDEHVTVEVVNQGWHPPDAGGAAVPAEHPSLNPKYTFQQFVIGRGNRFAHAAALAVAELPAQAYNPLFIHGLPGLGKTHLLQAIGNYVRRYGSGLRVRYATIEEFTSEFVEAIRERRTPAFKAGFRETDVVLIDDAQFLARGERTREEFFHTFNALLESGRQVVMSSDRSPDDLPGIERRLAERFQSGLIVELEPPELDVRRAILRKRAWIDGLEVAPEVLEEIARAPYTSVRALEGALVRIVAYASLREEPLNPELASHSLQRLGQMPRFTSVDVKKIVDAVAQEFQIGQEELLSRSRQPTAATARQVAMFLARELTEQSLPEIGRSLGGRNHTTVLHAVNKITRTAPMDPGLGDAVDRLRQQLQTRA